jgi:hypothetical protein
METSKSNGNALMVTTYIATEENGKYCFMKFKWKCKVHKNLESDQNIKAGDMLFDSENNLWIRRIHSTLS